MSKRPPCQRPECKTAREILTGHLLQFKDYLKPKPALMPWWLWSWMQGKTLHMEKIDPTHKDRAKIKS